MATWFQDAVDGAELRVNYLKMKDIIFEYLDTYHKGSLPLIVMLAMIKDSIARSELGRSDSLAEAFFSMWMEERGIKE